MDSTQSKGWWHRNWKRFVPLGCLGSVALFAGFAVLVVSLVFGMMKSSGAYIEALETVQNDPFVQQAIGTPVEAGFFVLGTISVSGLIDSGSRADRRRNGLCDC